MDVPACLPSVGIGNLLTIRAGSTIVKTNCIPYTKTAYSETHQGAHTPLDSYFQGILSNAI